VLVAIATALVGAACGKGGASSQRIDGTTTTFADAPQPSSSPTPEAPVETMTLPAIDTTPPVSVEPPANRNDRSTPVGLLCWYRQEYGLLYVKYSLTATGTENLLSDYRAFFAKASEEVRAVQPELPIELVPFAERYVSDIERAQALLDESREHPLEFHREVANFFRFDEYPGLDEYVQAANESCVGY
jgi:hypothetical protein